jgi:pimeloyl-ACP methyl ester carboxylesterase
MWHLCGSLLTTLILGAGAGHAGPAPLFAPGHDPARGLLVNRTVGSRPFDPIDPTRPTVVVAHGLNLAPHLVHCTIDQSYAAAIGARHGPSINVLGWDWNAATIQSLRRTVNDEVAVRQGYALGACLLRLGLDPSNVHLIGQSSGGLVVAAAARVLADATGRRVASVTLLDPAGAHHRLLFDRLGVTSSTLSVVHYWAPGPSGFGRAAPYPGVHDQSVPATSRWAGFVRPLRTDHLNTVRWHIQRYGG